MINPLVNRILIMAALGGAVYLFKSKKGKNLLSGITGKSDSHDEHAGCDGHDHAHGKKEDAILAEAKSKLKSETVSH